MRWPWIKRVVWEASEALRQEALRQLAASEAARQQQGSAHEAVIGDLRARLDAAERDRERMTDRVLQLSGQPPLYERTPLPTSGPAADSGPAPKTRISFEDVHEEFRRADRSGKLNLLKRG